MRLFIAAKLDESIADKISEYQAELKHVGIIGNYTKKDNMHMTLAFIGDYDYPDKILDVLKDTSFRPVKLSFDGIGHFGELYFVRLKDNPQLFGYVKRLRKHLSDNNIPFDKKRFLGHITILRKARFKDGITLPEINVPNGDMTLKKISLMRSEFTDNGVKYTEIGNI